MLTFEYYTCVISYTYNLVTYTSMAKSIVRSFFSHAYLSLRQRELSEVEPGIMTALFSTEQGMEVDIHLGESAVSALYDGLDTTNGQMVNQRKRR